MQITKISFGVSISRDFQSKRYDLEAVLEPWENHEESFKVLREKVCELANVHPGEYLTAAERAEDLELQISENQAAIQARKVENAQLLTELIGLRKTKQNILDFSEAINDLAGLTSYKFSEALNRAIITCEKLPPCLPQEDSDQPQSDLETEIENSDDEDDDEDDDVYDKF